MQRIETDLNNVNDEVFIAPFIQVFRKGAAFHKPVRNAAARIPGEEISKPFDGLVFDVEVRGSIAPSSKLEEGDIIL